MLKFVKGDAVKLIDPNSSLLRRLEDNGWKQEGAKEASPAPSVDIEALKKEADALGVSFHHKTGAEKLKALIDEKKAALWAEAGK